MLLYFVRHAPSEANALITIAEYFPDWRALRACNLTDHLPRD
jgi:hypothetical protein